MSKPMLISPMLDGFLMGDPISDHNGVRCCPAMKKDSDDKYIVKIISIPSSRTKLDALLLTGAYADEAAALEYFKELADGVVEEVSILNKLSQLEGFLPYDCEQVVQMEDDVGYDIYLLSSYKRTLDKYMTRVPMTHLAAVNLGIDLCSALAACRRAGYLYVDLKPENIFVCSDNEFRIGDLGFIRLDSLKYASLPDKYRSCYTAPEIADAFSSLNTTIDVYAAGLILYQAYNDGKLPVLADQESSEAFPPPEYADYEMSEIILKACAANPDDRWEDPVQMGQALVSYMQRNGANDLPIVPVPVVEETVAETEVVETVDDEAHGLYEQSEEPEESYAEAVDPLADIPAPEEIRDEEIYSEDENGNLTFLDAPQEDETAPGSEEVDVAYEEVTEELSEIMTYADELISHPAPDPVVQPEKIDVPFPDPIPVASEEEVEASGDPESTDDTESADAEEETVAVKAETAADTAEVDNDADEIEEDTSIDNEDEDYDDDEDVLPVKVNHLIRNVFIAIAALAIILAGFYYYTSVYTQNVSIQLSGSEGTLTVCVDSDIDDDKLTVICTDTYGNQLVESVVDGKAVFTNLLPNAAYTVEVQTSGFHRLTGKVSSAYSTPTQTNIVQFTAVCGSEDGSAILNFAIDGKDASQWRIKYSAEGEAEKEVIFTGHVATVTGLTVGKQYTFVLSPVDDIYFVGENHLTFTATKFVSAQNLQISEFKDGKLTINWVQPDDTQVDSWIVRCYNDNGYNVSHTVNETTATFTEIDPAQSYTVEVTASGMHQATILKVTKYPINVSNLSANVLSPEIVTLTWETDTAVSDMGWILQYTVNGKAAPEISGFKDNQIAVPAIPADAVCEFTLLSADESTVFNGTLSYTIPKTEKFNKYGISEGGLLFRMCKTPAVANWNKNHVSSFKTNFAPGEKASFLIALMMLQKSSQDNIVITFIIKDSAGTEVIRETSQEIWNNMWHSGYCCLDIPSIPDTLGDYTIDVYFNNQLAHTQSFTIQ